MPKFDLSTEQVSSINQFLDAVCRCNGLSAAKAASEISKMFLVEDCEEQPKKQKLKKKKDN